VPGFQTDAREANDDARATATREEKGGPHDRADRVARDDIHGPLAMRGRQRRPDAKREERPRKRNP